MKKILLYVLSFVLVLSLAACGDKNGKSSIDDVLNAISIPTEVSSSITLPSTDEKGEATITWESSNPELLDAAGYYYMQSEVLTRETQITLTAKVTLNGETKSKDFSVKVVCNKSDKYVLAYINIASVLKSSLSGNVNLKTDSWRTYSVSYESLNPEVITSEGVVTKDYEDKNAVVRITVTNTEDNVAKVFYKKVIVQRHNNSVFVDLIGDWANEKLQLFLRGEIDSLPTAHEKYPSKIIWLGGSKILMTHEGVAVRPIEYVDDVIKARITYDTLTVTKEFKVENVGGNTEEGFLNEFLTYIMPTEITAHHNYLWKQYGEDNDYFLHHQVKVNTGGVLNLLSGKALTINNKYFIDVYNETGLSAAWNNYHPELDATLGTTIVGKSGTSSLDAFYNHMAPYYGWSLDASEAEKQAAYQSYVIPNEENILWIVVHESGMPLEGNDAELLAKIQYDQAHGDRTYREASWNYQVDEGQIYQSFADTVYCWHAGGDYGKHLPYKNSNSIGIEMCINNDGNYDGAMRHDSKLVANLMYNYNLGFENVIRHYDTAGKECPSYMLRTDRYNEFLTYVAVELYAIKYLRDADVKWTVSNLEELFEVGGNGLYYAKGVSVPTDVTIKLDVTKGSYSFSKTVTVTLQPDTIDLTKWVWSGNE